MAKGHEETFGVMETLYPLIVRVAVQLNEFITAHLSGMVPMGGFYDNIL